MILKHQCPKELVNSLSANLKEVLDSLILYIQSHLKEVEQVELMKIVINQKRKKKMSKTLMRKCKLKMKTNGKSNQKTLLNQIAMLNTVMMTKDTP